MNFPFQAVNTKSFCANTIAETVFVVYNFFFAPTRVDGYFLYTTTTSCANTLNAVELLSTERGVEQ